MYDFGEAAKGLKPINKRERKKWERNIEEIKGEAEGMKDLATATLEELAAFEVDIIDTEEYLKSVPTNENKQIQEFALGEMKKKLLAEKTKRGI